MKTNKQQTLSKKVDNMIHKVNIDWLIRKALHLKKEKPSRFHRGKEGFYTQSPTKFEMNIINRLS